MSEIKIIEQSPFAKAIGDKKESEGGWDIKVRVDELDFDVRVDKEYWRELTQENENVTDLVKRSFEFLLTQEPKESILRRFNLRDIERYFPNYPDVIR